MAQVLREVVSMTKGVGAYAPAMAMAPGVPAMLPPSLQAGYPPWTPSMPGLAPDLLASSAAPPSSSGAATQLRHRERAEFYTLPAPAPGHYWTC